jgi:hypothetical protein
LADEPISHSVWLFTYRDTLYGSKATCRLIFFFPDFGPGRIYLVPGSAPRWPISIVRDKHLTRNYRAIAERVRTSHNEKKPGPPARLRAFQAKPNR